MRTYRHIHFLSLDIVLGALATSCLSARLFRAAPGWAWWIALAFTVWLLYTGDHILDAWKHRKGSSRELHRFIFRNRRLLLWAMGVIGIVDLLIIFNFLDRVTLKFGFMLAGFVLLFYAMRHLFRRNRVLFIPGEFFVLVLYMGGTWMGPLVSRSGELNSMDALVMIMFAGVLLMNLGLISLYDIHLDSRLGIGSLASGMGQRSTRNMVLLTGILVYIAALLQFLVYGAEWHAKFALILSGMCSILLLILFMPSVFRKNDLFRMAADAVLYLGFLSLFINS